MKREFAWDDDKNEANILKHGINFADVVSVFDDPFAVFIYDEEHSVWEERFIIIGKDERFKVISVCHCYRDNDMVIRLISAREATKREKEVYNER
ncbi:hypothetical protein FACS1894133_4260 [Clostridia bacterium]|nr:hypothetical protein FACS1894133_4260 [Clostridia bacterium]